ncbi:TPA: DUF1482 family protein [Enterobacter kobei]|nr:DUF1482 family protein [Enterobacter kobei]
MRFLTHAFLLWALTVRTYINGDFETLIIEMHDTEVQCNQSKDKQRIFGECLEAEAIIPAEAI